MKTFITMLAVLAVPAISTAQPGGTHIPPALPPASSEGTPDNRHASSKAIGEKIKSANLSVVTLSDDILKPIALAKKGDRLKELQRIEDLRKGFKSALLSAHLLDETCISLDRELRHATNAYDAVAKAYRDRAEDYQDSYLKSSTTAMAEHYEKLRDKCPEQRKQLDELRVQIPTLIKMTRESGQFLDDYSLFVRSYANAIVPDDVEKQHTDTIHAYVRNFESFEKALDKYRKEGAK
jgi:hypothetical protein